MEFFTIIVATLTIARRRYGRVAYSPVELAVFGSVSRIKFFILNVAYCSRYWIQLMEYATFRGPNTLKLSDEIELKDFY